MRIERFDGTHHEILEMHLVQNYNSGKKKDNLEALSKKSEPRERNPCAPVLEEWTLEKTSRQADCDSKSSVELGKKYNAEQERFKLR